MKSFQPGMRSTLTGRTSPPKIRRSVASPEAETMSYWPPPPPPPVRISATIWFDEPASLRWILQPVCCSNGLRQLAWAYPGHSIRFRAPSPFPIEVGRPEPEPFEPDDFLEL